MKIQMPPVAQFSLPSQNTGQQNQSGQGNQSASGMPPVATFSLPGGASQTTQNSGGNMATNAISGVGNFLFPIVGDIGADIQGKSDKSALEQVGDAGLSALPFIPGLDETGVGEGIDAAVEGGEAAAKGAGVVDKIADAGSNLASKGKNAVASVVNKIPGGVVGKGAAVGYGAGVASNLSQGQGLDTAFDPNLNTVLGAVGGGLLPGATKGLGFIKNEVAGIDPQVQTELERMGSQANPKDAQLYDQYINATKAHATDFNKPSALQIAADQVDKAAQVVDKKTNLAGAAVGKAKEASANIPLGSLSDVGNSFWKDVQDKYGLNLYNKRDGSVVAKKVAGSMIDNSPSDVSRITNIGQQLSDLGTKGGTAKKATEVMGNIRKLIGDAKNEGYGERGTQFEGVMKHTINNLNDVVRKSSPALAKANDTYSGLRDLQEEISGMAGKNVDKGALLMRRRFSGDKAGQVSDFFGKMYKATGIDLSKHAVLAKHAIESVGGRADRTLLEDIMKESTGGASSLSSKALNIGVNAAKKKFANPETIGRNLVKGKTGLLDKAFANKGGIPAKVGAELGARFPTSFLQNNQ